MKLFFTVFILEFRRLLSRRNIIIFLSFVCLSLYFVQIGISRNKDFNESKKKFKEIERLKVKSYINYPYYATYGFRLLFNPSPLNIFFLNSSTISDLTANVDSGERLYIYNSLKGRNLFSEKMGGFKDFSGIILLLGTLLVLYFGYDAFLHKDYLRSLTGFINPKKLFLSILGSRLFLLALFFLMTVSGALIMIKINKLKLLKDDYNYLYLYVMVMLLMLLFFFIFGTIAGALKSRFIGFLTVIVVWFVFIFLIPGTVRSIMAGKADNITSTYNLELQKLQTLMEFEKNVYKEAGKYTDKKARTEGGRKIAENFWDKEFKEIQKFENQMARETSNNIQFFYKLALFFPTTFYHSTANEISSKGYKNFIEFFSYILDLKEKFVRFIIDKRYYAEDSTVVSFVKADENMFYAQSRLPNYFWLGVALILLYSIGLVFLSYFLFKKSLRK